MNLNCPQCGELTAVLVDRYCEDCFKENQSNVEIYPEPSMFFGLQDP